MYTTTSMMKTARQRLAGPEHYYSGGEIQCLFANNNKIKTHGFIYYYSYFIFTIVYRKHTIILYETRPTGIKKLSVFLRYII